MTKRFTYTAIITDQQAEGAPESREEREPTSPAQTTLTTPAVRPSPTRFNPTAETGVIAAVVLSGEGADSSDTQDASRTTAETQTSPVMPLVEQRAPLSALIVEDTQEIAEILQITLRRMDMITAHESHVSRAFARFYDMKPDIVLLDIGLPDGTGWKVLDSIKEHQQQLGEPMPIVIVITGYGDAANRLVGKLHGVYSYLVKPFTTHEVERIVRRALSGVVG
jgi:CheY-like chemotaxis protein